MRVHNGPIWLLASVLASAACGPRANEAAPGEGVASGEAAPDLPALPSDAPPLQVIAPAGKRYAPGMIAQGKPFSGKLAQGERSDHLLVLEGGRCYRAVGVGGDGVTDMDLFLYDPAGVQRNQDGSQDRYPLLGTPIEICPVVAGAYRLQVQMYEGGGEFAVGLYRTP